MENPHAIYIALPEGKELVVKCCCRLEAQEPTNPKPICSKSTTTFELSVSAHEAFNLGGADLFLGVKIYLNDLNVYRGCFAVFPFTLKKFLTLG